MYQTMCQTDVNTAAKKIHDFLAEYDPAFGYATGVPGQENEEQVVQTIAQSIIRTGVQPLVMMISELVLSVPEASNEGDDLLAELAML